jgi:hypothetical protein
MSDVIEWIVVGTALCPPTILVENSKTKQKGCIYGPFISDEWNRA